MNQTRRADATWNGNLTEGRGVVSASTSHAFTELPVTWASRIESSDGRTSPEELVAAAHAACFSMALSHGLAQAGTPPERLDVDATVTFVPGTGITKIQLAVDATVPGIDENAFRAAAEAAKENCPVSTALASVPEITLAATLT
jgi:osmotically inducible protein OsmC